jgi:chromosome partitioning protein
MNDTTQAIRPPVPGAGRLRARVIVFGNEKGGTGKSTAAMHSIVGLVRGGYSVGSVDIDVRQATLSRYLENRATFVRTRGIDLKQPEHRRIAPGEDALTHFRDAMAEMLEKHEVVVVDTPGSDAPLSRLAHSYADTLVTPINDSFIDLDLLARVDGDSLKVLGPSIYAEMVWEQRKTRMAREGRSLDWLVLRNRLSATDSRNKRNMERVLNELSRRVGFRLAPGFGDRVIFREMFLSGLTLLDLRDAGVRMTMSHLTARQEVRDLLAALAFEETPAGA